MAATLPLAFAKPHWYTSAFVAKRMGVTLRTVQYWCRSGLLARMGYVVALVRDKQDRRYWIRIPPERRYAMLRKVVENPLDTLPTSTAECNRERPISKCGVTSLC